MKRFFTVTSPDNSLAVSIYAMFTFYAICFLYQPPPVIQSLGVPWEVVLLISASAALFATLSAPKRRDPDRSLIIEFWACISLCTLMGWLVINLGFWYRTSDGSVPIITLGAGLIFFVGFGFRIRQIVGDRKALRRYRASHPGK